MPLIIFLGISGVGALFLIVFLTAIFREERDEQWVRTGDHAASTIPLVMRAASNQEMCSHAIVMRHTILSGTPNRLTRVPVERTQEK